MNKDDIDSYRARLYHSPFWKNRCVDGKFEKIIQMCIAPRGIGSQRRFMKEYDLDEYFTRSSLPPHVRGVGYVALSFVKKGSEDGF